MLRLLYNPKKEQLFKQLFETYYVPFCMYARRYVEDPATCEDIVSEVFVTLWNRFDSFDAESPSAVGYIKISVRNSCLNYLKHQEHACGYAEFMQYKAPVYETTPDSVYTLDEMYRMLYATLQQLPEDYRKVFVESCFNGKTQAEIAEELQVSVKTVNRYKQKVLDILRQELKDYLPLFYLVVVWKVLERPPLLH